MVDHNATGKWFAELLTKRDASQPLVYSFKDVTMFCLYKFEAVESEAFDAALKNPSSVVFSDAGNVKFGEITIVNPLLSHKSYHDMSGPDIESLRSQWTFLGFDDTMIITRNMRYVLHKNPKTKRWNLLYNGLHTKAFKQYYNDVMSRATPKHKQWGATTIATPNGLNLRQVFRHYCNSMQFRHREDQRTKGKLGYIDPVCHIITNPAQCQQSALFAKNFTEFDQGLVRRNGTVLRQLGSGGGTMNVPHCLCSGMPNQYIRSNNIHLESFVDDFENAGRCDATLQLSVCTNNIQAKKSVEIDNTTFNIDCGGMNEVDNSELSEDRIEENEGEDLSNQQPQQQEDDDSKGKSTESTTSILNSIETLKNSLFPEDIATSITTLQFALGGTALLLLLATTIQPQRIQPSSFQQQRSYYQPYSQPYY